MDQASIYPRHFFSRAVQRQPTGYVLMPFDPAFNSVHLAIKRAVTLAGLTPLRADDEFLTRSALEKILRGIAEAEVVIADMTGRNANVFYEVGIAHTVKENVVLLAQNVSSDLPFDLRHIDHLAYENHPEGLI